MSTSHPLFLLVALLVGTAHAATPSSPTAIDAQVLIEGRAIVIGPVADKSAPHTAAGRTSTHDEIRFVERTNVIPAKLGTVFGFRYRLSGLPINRVLTLEMRSIHPPMKGPDGRERTVSTSQFEVESTDGLYLDDLVYLLSEPYEVLPGKWVLEIRYQGRQLISREFILR